MRIIIDSVVFLYCCFVVAAGLQADAFDRYQLMNRSLMAHLELAGIVQRYGSHTVVDGVSFSVEAGSIGCLLGTPAAARPRAALYRRIRARLPGEIRRWSRRCKCSLPHAA